MHRLLELVERVRWSVVRQGLEAWLHGWLLVLVTAAVVLGFLLALLGAFHDTFR